MGDRVAQWLSLVDRLYPAADAEAWDSVGLQVGDPDDDVSAVLVCLDVTAATIAEASQRGAQLLLAHHPLLFRPLARLTPATAAGRLALQAARQGVAVMAAHTNVDAAVEGTTAPIVAALGLTDVEPLSPAAPEALVKLVVFAPVEATGVVMDAAFAAGGGQIGEYDECSFRIVGTGTFRPSGRANPAVGQREQRNDVTEQRLEMVVPRSRMRSVVDAVVAAHPYEEVALDVFALLTPPNAPSAARKGIGRVGQLPEAMTVGDVAARLRSALPSPHLRLAGDAEREVRRVAACGGAGDSLMEAAIAAGAELYVTGDLRHHPALDALTQGLSVIDAGHYATEAPALPDLVAQLAAAAAEHGLSARLLASETSTEPWTIVSNQEEIHQ